VGYGSKYDHSDMNNTLVALEAMRASEALFSEGLPIDRLHGGGFGLEGGGVLPGELPEPARHKHLGTGVD
jgi:hypothetical protein